METLELQIDLEPVRPWSEILIAELSELGFDSFVETRTGILAYAQVGLDVDSIISETSLNSDAPVKYKISQKVIAHENWNSLWESDFEPVYVEEYASILAPFHDDSNAKGEVVKIQPQMSFGTGHHQTTWMMTKALFELNFMPKVVLDMGTGTGVLAIFAEKLGAEEILAIDIEDWSAENARENAALNGCSKIDVKCGDVDLIPEKQFGLIIANINKNILKAHMPVYANSLKTGGVLLLSGFFDSDVEEMTDFCAPFGLKLERKFKKDEWAALQLTKTN